VFAANERNTGMTTITDTAVEANKQAVLDFIERAINGHDLAAIDDFTDNDRLRRSLNRLLTGFPDARMDVEWILAEHDKVSAWVRYTGTHLGDWRDVAPTGRTVTGRASITVEVHDGRATDFWLCADWLGMLQQLGVIDLDVTTGGGND
jgi:predicted ester cyclase